MNKFLGLIGFRSKRGFKKAVKADANLPATICGGGQ